MWTSHWADTAHNPWTSQPGTVLVATGGGADAERSEDQ